METLVLVNAKVESYKLVRRKHEGKTYMVVPVTMMVEGVHSGNQGPVFHPISELGKIPDSWNGIPVMINHPEKEGMAVSANTPEILEESSVGKVFGTFVEDTKLKAMAWLDELKLQEISVDLYNQINEGTPIEVSIGVFTDSEEEEGDWNGEHYNKVAINHRPDHLAILPDAKGACSIEDGCGLCVNTEDQKVADKLYKLAIQSGFSLIPIGNHAEAGYKERMESVYSALRGIDTKDSYCYLEEMYDDSLVYSQNSEKGSKMYKQAYKYESGKIELVGEPVEVRRKVEYVLNQLVRTKFKKEVKMAENCTPCIKKKVDELILNSAGRWTESDRDFLQALDENKLDKLVPQVIEKEKEVQVNVLSKEDQDALAAYKSEKKTKRDRMISDIQANTSKEMWPTDALETMSDDNLKRILDSAKKSDDVDFSLNGNGVDLQENKEVEPLYPTGIEVETNNK